MAAHNWKPAERGVSRGGKPGQWHRCAECGGQKFYWDDMSDFQKQLEDGMCFIDWKLESEFEKELRLSIDPTGKKGYHALLADDCALAAMHESIELVYGVHES